ncbi:MAG: serine protease [Azonexus sp.]
MTARSVALRLVLFWLIVLPGAAFADLPATIERVKPSIVAIGTYKKTQSPPFVFRGTGFVTGDGTQVVTNAHVLPEAGIPDAPELAVLTRPSQGSATLRRARVITRLDERDIALIRLEGPALPALQIGDSGSVREGQPIAFTGFPIGGALGFSPVTHRGIVAAITPIALPGGNANQINEKLIKQLKRGSFEIFQLDATAYPGNSGSPVYDAETGVVIGIINMVFVKGSKEAALSAPSGISYAIPAIYVQQLLHGN